MKLDRSYIEIKYSLITSLLLEIPDFILDISYDITKNGITIQIVLLNGFSLPKEYSDQVRRELDCFDIIINELNLTKEQFNESKGEWNPKYYKWLNHLLFSKTEVL